MTNNMIQTGTMREQKTKKIIGGCVMKKMLKSKKGFSLIELIIAVAILAVLAAVSINVFGDILGRGRDSATSAGVKAIETAVTAYVSETGDKALTNLKDAAGNAISNGVDVDKLLEALTKTYELNLDNNGNKWYGPWLNASDVKSPQPGQSWKVTYDVNTGKVKVESVASTVANAGKVVI